MLSCFYEGYRLSVVFPGALAILLICQGIYECFAVANGDALGNDYTIFHKVTNIPIRYRVPDPVKNLIALILNRRIVRVIDRQ